MFAFLRVRIAPPPPAPPLNSASVWQLTPPADRRTEQRPPCAGPRGYTALQWVDAFPPDCAGNASSGHQCKADTAVALMVSDAFAVAPDRVAVFGMCAGPGLPHHQVYNPPSREIVRAHTRTFRVVRGVNRFGIFFYHGKERLFVSLPPR